MLKIDKHFFYVSSSVVALSIISVALAYFKAPVYIVFALVSLTLLAIFILVIKLMTENNIYSFLRRFVWGDVIIFLTLSSYTAFSYLWAEREVNEVFSVDPGNLKWTLSFLTILFFLKFIAKTFLQLSFIFFLLYSIYWLVQIATNKDVKILRDFLFGLLIAFAMGSLMALLGIIEGNTKYLAESFSLETDFSTYHRCTGDGFEDIKGVIFLSSDNVLVAKKSNEIQNEWDFQQVKCITD